MNTIVRRIVSTPVRSATDTWATIAMLLAPDPTGTARREFNHVSGLACAAISAEALREDALVLQSSTAVVRLYCLHGEEAIMNPTYDESSLAVNPTEGEWRLSIPCEPSDLRWLNRELASLSENMIFRAVGQAPSFGAEFQRRAPEPAEPRGLAKVLKMGAFFRP
ncbi:MAG: hypothetical protein MUF01_05085 [Bryobacterales bacterium]|jgi:hypothetical protein|nr:hypothetical protein [Bryobacterales bacterium]